MNSFYVMFLLLVVPLAYSADTNVASTESTGERGIGIVKEKRDEGDYLFVEKKTGKRLGRVIPPELRGARIGGIQTSWSPDGSKVAVLVSYGTRLSAIFIYSLRKDKKMRLVDFSGVDPVKIYDERYPTKHFLHLAEQAPGYDENALGHWVTNDSLTIVCGDAVMDPEDDEQTRHLLVVLELKIVGDRAQIQKQFLPGVLSNKQAEMFLRDREH